MDSTMLSVPLVCEVHCKLGCLQDAKAVYMAGLPPKLK